MAFNLDPISSGYSQAKINQNFQALEDELNNRVLRRDSEIDEPNQMAESLDMNNNDIINAGDVDADTVTIGGVQLDPGSLEGVLPGQSGQAGKFLQTDGTNATWEVPAGTEVSNTPAGNITATDVQGAINELDSDLTSGLAGKADLSHTHTESEITDLDKYSQSEVDSGFVDQDSDTGAANIPTGTTAQRPTTANGKTRFNTDTNEGEMSDANAFHNIINNRSGLAGGTVDAITVTFSRPLLTWADGASFRIRAAGANTSTTPTVSPNGLAAKTIVKNGNQALSAGDIAGADHELALVYNSTTDKVELLNPAVAGGGAGASSWVNFNGTGTVAIRDSDNISSITDNGVGDYSPQFTSALSTADYAISGSSNAAQFVIWNTTNGGTDPTTSNYRFRVRATNGVAIDVDQIHAVTNGG